MAQAVQTAPIALTQEEYRRDWEPRGWQLLIIGPTASWRQEWGEWEAIRDIVQNALDESEGYYWEFDRQGLWIGDQGKGVQVADFLLGPLRLKPPYARGRFGEGMKIATLALLRQGYPVYVRTVGRELYMVFLRQMVDGEADTLAALWRMGGTRTGTHFHILGYFGSAFEDRFAVNILERDILHQGPSPLAEPIPRYNQLIASPPGRLYARDIYMRDIDSPWSYVLWGFEMAPDRHAPKSEQDMWVDMGRLWATVTDVSLLERFLGMVREPPEEETIESHFVNMDPWSMGDEPVSEKRYADLVAEQGHAWREAWRRKFGDNAVIRTTERWDGTVRHLGYEPVGVFWSVRDTLALAIHTDAALVQESQERLREVQAVPDSRLTPRQRPHLGLARKIVERLLFTPVPVHAAMIPPASDRMRTAGLYSRSLREIYIATDQLERARSAVDTMIQMIDTQCQHPPHLVRAGPCGPPWIHLA
ncbi:MAG: hypothetical protein ACE5IA_08155 [Dehalococcoidia bacterium]